MNKNINIIQSALFPWHVRFLGFVLPFIGFIKMPSNIFVIIIFCAIGIGFSTTFVGIQFNLKKKQYHPYYLIYGIKFGKKYELKNISFIYITQKKTKQTIYSAYTAKPATLINTIYDGYLQFMNRKKLFLKSDKNKTKLLRNLKKIAKIFEVKLYDNNKEIN